jgi:hypothetical protein
MPTTQQIKMRIHNNHLPGTAIVTGKHALSVVKKKQPASQGFDQGTGQDRNYRQSMCFIGLSDTHLYQRKGEKKRSNHGASWVSANNKHNSNIL